jgi:protein phosphatase PTC1
MIVRLNRGATLETATNKASPIGVEGDHSDSTGKISEVEKIVGDARRKVQEDGVPGVGISGSNSGKGHDPSSDNLDEDAFKKISMERVVEEEPGLVEGDTPEMSPEGANAISPDIRNSMTKGIPQSRS